jgi:predicted RND superfamily exporter protein
MASAGLVVVFGVGATLVTAVTIVPALLKLTRALPGY